MARWLELLAKRIADSYSETPAGHAARLNGLHLDEARDLCPLLGERLGAAWDVMVVAEQPEAQVEVGLDVAIERRNDKRKSRLFIVPADLVSEAAASLADAESHEVTEYLRPIAAMLTRRLPRQVRDVAEDAMKRAPTSTRLGYLCALPESPTLEDIGRELWRLGLIPDLAPGIERLTENRECVATLMDDRKTSASLHQRVEATGLGDVDLQESLLRLLRESRGSGPRDWLQRIVEQPELGLTFDRWSFPSRDRVDLRAIEVHSFIDPRTNRPYGWSGLALEAESLKASTRDGKAKVTVRWSTEPSTPAGNPLYEISLETSEPQPVTLLTETQRHRASKVKSWHFRPSEVEGVEEGSLRVRVVVRSYLDGQAEPVTGESDEFLLVSELVETSHSSAFPPTRSLPDFLLERATPGKAVSSVSRCEILPGQGVKIELDERQRRRIPLNPVLDAAERLMLQNPGKGGALQLRLSPEVQWTAEQLEWQPVEGDLQRFGSQEWWRNRGRLFARIAGAHGSKGLVESCELAEHTEEILSYCRGYGRALEEVLESEGGDPAAVQTLAALVQLDTVQLLQDWEAGSDGGERVVGAFVSPLHPLRLLWHLTHEALVRDWIRQAADRALKAVLPKPQTALQLDGSNCPAFLAGRQSLLYHFDSPLFHWPLYVNAEMEDPHRAAALVRWGLGFGTLETLTTGQEVAAEALAQRLRSYAQLHPYVHTLKVNAVNAGDGQLLVEALSGLDEQALAEPEEDEAEDSPALERAYEVRLYGSPPLHRIGAFLDECAGQRRRGQGLPRKLDRLFRPGDGFLRPHLFWAKRDLQRIETDEPPEEAHLSFVAEYFRPEPALAPDRTEDGENSVSTYGLQLDLASDFTASDGDAAWVRTVRLPEASEVAPHPADRRFTRELLRLHRLLLRAAVRLRGGAEGQWPATRVPVSSEQFNLFSRLHETSDWVLTVDRNLSVDLFDSPRSTRAELQENARRYLIDYAPDRAGSAGQQLMISTSWVDEVSGLLRETLREMFISTTDLACEEVLKLLKSVSGRLVMRVARYPQVAKEAISLAVVRDVLRGRGELEGAFLVPVDEHIPLFTAPARSDGDAGDQQPDLLLVRPRLDKKATLAIDIVEVKYRRHRYMAYEPALWSDMLAATRAAEVSIATNCFPANPAAQLDVPIRRRQFKVVLSFYAGRAIRHGLLDPETGSKVLQWLVNLQKADLALQVSHRGFVYCPELSFETEDHTHEAMKVTLIGRGALPRYTSLHATDPVSSPPARTAEERPSAVPPSRQAAPTREARAKDDGSPPVGATRNDTPAPPKVNDGSQELRVLLGHQPHREQEVIFRPSLQGNPHALIVGIPGMGKTTALLNVCQALARGGVNPFVIDFHGDIARGLQAGVAGESCHVLDATRGLPFNPLEVDPARRQDHRGWKTHYFEVAEILASIYPSFGELQVGRLREALHQCYEAAGFARSPQEAAAPGFYEFWRCLRQKAEAARDLRKITTRLQPVFDLGLFQEQPDRSFSLPELLSRVTVVDLHRLELEENQRVAASFFLQRLYREMFSHAETKQLRNAVIFDEAHRVAKLKLIPRMMQECRKYGILFILSSQRVEDFDQGVLDSAGNHLYLQVNHPDAQRLAAYLGTGGRAGDVTEKLQNLHKFHALFRSEDCRPFVQVRLAPPQAAT